jgi:hypothetical protein
MIAKDALLAAHVQYELQQYSPDLLSTTVRAEISALYAWLGTRKVADVVEPQQLSAWLQRNVLDRPLPPELVDFVRENLVVALELLQEDRTPIQELLPKPTYDRAVAAAGSMGELRRQIIHQVVTSSVYSRLIANVLYQGIKSFLLTENGMARTIPGATSLLRFGQNALNATVPQLEKNVDKQLVAFIDDNIQQTIADSEAFLNRSLDESLVRRVGDELWNSLAGETLASLTRSLDKEHAMAGGDVLQEAWQHLRTTAVVQDILQGVVRSFFLRYGKQDVRTLLEKLALDETVAQRELLALAAPIVEQALATGYLEARIRAHLEPFYDQYFAAAENA